MEAAGRPCVAGSGARGSLSGVAARCGLGYEEALRLCWRTLPRCEVRVTQVQADTTSARRRGRSKRMTGRRRRLGGLSGGMGWLCTA
eukprot:1804324-Rhodomonas_salina.2